MTAQKRLLKRILITGGAGFIGSHTVDLLLKTQPDAEVVVLDNLFSGKLENLPLNHPNFQFIEGDVLEFPLLEELLVDCDAVLHLAAIPSVSFSMEHPIYAFQVNTQGFLHTLEAVRRAKHTPHLVYASSAAVYGDTHELPCRDDVSLTSAPTRPDRIEPIMTLRRTAAK